MMSSLHLTNAYHATSGGIRTFYDALLDAANHERRRLALVVPGPTTEIVERGPFGRIYVLKAPRTLVFDRRYRVLLPHRYFPFTHSALVDVLRRERPDVVEICDKYSLPLLAAMLRKQWHAGVPRPTLVGLSCERFDDNMAAYLSGSRVARGFTQWYMRHIYGPPFDVHIAVSEYTADELRSALHDRPVGFVRVCPMGVDLDGFGPHHRHPAIREGILQRCGGTAASVLLMYAGRLSPEKNVPLLVETMRELMRDSRRDYRFAVIGDGPLAEWLRDQAREGLQGRMWVCGNLDRRTLAVYYASCDVFVHPNAREPFGIGPLEAMASAVPVVLPAAGGVLQYATEFNAWLTEPRASAYAAAVHRAVGDTDRAAAARATVLDFAWSRATRRYFALYDEVHRLRTQPNVVSIPLAARLGNARRVTHT